MIANLPETIYLAQQISAERARTNSVFDFGPLPVEPSPKRAEVVAMLAKTGLRFLASWQSFCHWFKQSCLTYPYNFNRNI